MFSSPQCLNKNLQPVVGLIPRLFPSTNYDDLVTIESSILKDEANVDEAIPYCGIDYLRTLPKQTLLPHLLIKDRFFSNSVVAIPNCLIVLI